MEEKEEQKKLDNITGANTEESRVFIKPEPAQEDELASIHWPSEDIGCQFSKGQVEVPGEYFFENDHLALLEEGGDDLQSLLRTLAVLEAQKVGFTHVSFSYLVLSGASCARPREAFESSDKGTGDTTCLGSST